MVASYNGWKASQSPAEIGVVPFVVNGVSFPSGARGGDVGLVFRYLAEQYVKRVEPLITPGCWGYYYKQSANSATLLSCHSSGTALDFNAPLHPNGKRGTFTAAKVAEIRKILAELGGLVYWGGDAWGNGTPDEMHFEIKTGVTEAQVAAVANRIRAGGLTQGDDMPTADEVAKTLLDWAVRKPDGGTRTLSQMIAADEGYGARIERIDQGSHGGWGYGRRIENTEAVVAQLVGQVAGLTEALKQLAAAPGQAIDLEAIKSAVSDAIQSIDVTVKLDNDTA